jgi:hypothetical protein
MSYPVTFAADYVEQRNRLTSFFRLILAIPLMIFLAFYGLAATVAIIIAWFAIVFTARYPKGLYEFVAGFTRCLTRVTAYASLLCDPYPSFSGTDDASYPVRMEFAPLEHYSRPKTLFRIILAIPIAVLRYVMALLLEVASIAAWVVILFLGRMPRGLFDVMVLANSYVARSDSYLYLLTETYPPFQDETTRAAGVSGQLPPTPQPSTGATGVPGELPGEAPPPAPPIN